MSEVMTAPVTRGELLEALSAYPTRVELKEALSAYPTRVELKEELATFRAELRTELRTELSAFRSEMRAEMRDTLSAFRVELGEEVARHMRAGFEDMRKLFGVLDDKQHAQNDQHAALAGRVDRLEVAVFDPPNPKP